VAAELVHAFVASSAQLLADGSFCVLGGGINGIVVRSDFPYRLPSLAFIVRIRFGYDDLEREHEFRIRVRAPDERWVEFEGVQKIEPTANWGPRIGPLEDGVIRNVQADVVYFEFDMPGIYVFEFVIDGEVIGTLGLPVAQISEFKKT
jgi:hypothetical protein